MPVTDVEPPRCAVGRPSRRFYVHVRSFGSLLAAHPSNLPEVAGALALAAASRAVEQVVEDRALFGHPDVGTALADAARALHEQAATALQDAFQCIVHLVPPRFGATEPLLASAELINSWCYEDGYFTYATDDAAARVMYLETGSLKALRSRIRRDPDADPSLRMITGDSLFNFDQGLETASAYKKQHVRLLRHAAPVDTAAVDAVRAAAEEQTVGQLAGVDPLTVAEVLARCRRGIDLTLSVLTRSWDEAASNKPSVTERPLVGAAP